MPRKSRSAPPPKRCEFQLLCAKKFKSLGIGGYTTCAPEELEDCPIPADMSAEVLFDKSMFKWLMKNSDRSGAWFADVGDVRRIGDHCLVKVYKGASEEGFDPLNKDCKQTFCLVQRCDEDGEKKLYVVYFPANIVLE